jgi:hypothetical protein
MPQKPNSIKQEPNGEDTNDEQTEPEKSSIVQDISENSYYYDDAFGYKVYDPELQDEDDEEA